MNKLIGIGMLSLSFVAGCEQRSTSMDPPVDDPLAPPATAPSRTPPTSPMSPAPGRGEGEAERPLSETELPERYREELASDPTLASTASGTSLIAENGHLVLRGTAPTEGLKTSLGDLARALADGREVKNEIIVIAD